MKVAIFEVCRRPEFLKEDTEAMVLSTCFAALDIEYELYSNDGYWADRPKAGAVVDRELIRKRLGDPSVDVAHLALHGSPKGLVLKWTGPTRHRAESDVLTGSEIRGMGEFRAKLVVSGACGSAGLAADFLAAGATAFVAPAVDVPWKNLGAFFQSFYSSLRAGATAEAALASARSGRLELDSYRVYSGQPS